MIALLLFLINLSQKQIDDQPIILDGITDMYASEFIFASTPFGIYTFDRNSGVWGRITQATGLPDNQVDIIGLDEGILWVATPGGLASADVRINDWQVYEMDGRMEGLVFDEEYIWAGGDFGIKRFDKYGEIWEDVARTKVSHIFSEKNYLWFATDSGVLRYNREYEKIEEVPGAPQYSYSYIIDTPGRIWFISEDHYLAYKKNTEDWSAYDGFEISDYSSLGDSLFVASEGKVFLYEPKSDDWIPFRDIKGLQSVNGVFAGAENILFATDDGLLVHNWSERSRITYNRSNGLETDSLIDVYQEERFIFVVSGHHIQFLDTETDVWKVEKLKPPERRGKRVFYLDEAGAHARLIKNTDLRVAGRLYYSESRTQSNSHMTRTDYENINLKLSGQHSSNRLFSLYCDDTDREQIMYGSAYRGLDRDLLYRWNGGHLKSGYFEFDLVPRFSTLGAHTKLRYKTHTMDIQGGQLQSRPRSDFFTGRSTEKKLSLFDTNYRENIFYSIYATPQLMRKGVDTVFVDDQMSSTNRIDTRTGSTIAGITGDFDPLINGTDYFIEYDKGILYFLSSRSDSDIIVLFSNGEEIVIQSNLVSGHVLENVYSVGPNVIPNTFSLTITDTLGQIHPLSEFGLDGNGDNQVDPEFIDYDLGYLVFPQRRPFPAEVYDDTVHIYTMDIQFLSQSVFYYLSFTPILKSHEKVYVDGELMVRGTDYVIDYTSGILLFLKEDIISDFSEIEVQYSSVERDRQDMFYSAQPNIAIGNSIRIAPGFSLVEDKNIFHISGRLHTGLDQDKSIKLVPQAAIDEEKRWAQDYSLIANYKIFSVNVQYQGYSEGFECFGANERRYGRLDRSATVSARIEPFPYVRFDGQFRREYELDSLNNRNIAQYTYGKINYLNRQFPNGYILLGKDHLPDHVKRRVKVNVHYDFQAWKSKVKLNSVVRNIVVEPDEGERNRVMEYIINTHFSLPFSVHAGIYFRRNTLHTGNLREKIEEEIRGTLNVDVIPGLYYTGNYDLRTTVFFADASKDLFFKQYFYSNLNVAPGRWFRTLGIVNFSLGVGNNFDEHIQNLPADYRRPSLMFRPIEDVSISSVSNSRSYFATVQFTPTSDILIWVKRTLNKSGIGYYAIPDLTPTLKDELRIEYEPGDLGIFAASIDRRTHSVYPAQTFQNIYFEWSMPWSASMRTKFTTSYRLSKDDYGSVSTRGSELKSSLESLFRFGSRSFATFNLSGAKQEDYSHKIGYSIVPGVSLNLNLFRFLYVQLDYESAFTLGNSSTYTLSTKITGQF